MLHKGFEVMLHVSHSWTGWTMELTAFLESDPWSTLLLQTQLILKTRLFCMKLWTCWLQRRIGVLKETVLLFQLFTKSSWAHLILFRVATQIFMWYCRTFPELFWEICLLVNSTSLIKVMKICMNAAIKTLPLPKIKRNKIVSLLSTQQKYLSILNEQLKKRFRVSSWRHALDLLMLFVHFTKMFSKNDVSFFWQTVTLKNLAFVNKIRLFSFSAAILYSSMSVSWLLIAASKALFFSFTSAISSLSK